MIGIIDFGMGNLRSVQKAFERVGFEARILSQPAELKGFDKLVLPGVGAFADAIATLRKSGLVEPILEHITTGRPILGICLGLQLLFEVGEEDGEHVGLGVLGGRCVRFDVDRTQNLKVPHMGWNQLRRKKPTPLLRDIPEDASVYFVHSYHVVPTDPSIIATTTDYGGEFVSSIWRDNLMATQFHPEKSQGVGMKVLENFADL